MFGGLTSSVSCFRYFVTPLYPTLCRQLARRSRGEETHFLFCGDESKNLLCALPDKVPDKVLATAGIRSQTNPPGAPGLPAEFPARLFSQSPTTLARNRSGKSLARYNSRSALGTRSSRRHRSW